MLEHLDLTSLLRRWSSEAVAHAAELNLVLPPGASSGWIGAAPAATADLDAAQRRLGVTLPPSYREFLMVSNGWPVTSFDFGALRPASEVAWLRELDPELVEIWQSTESATGWVGDEVPDNGSPLLERSLLVNTGTDRILLDPAHRVPSGEWAAVGFTSWYPGAGTPVPSFRAALESHYASFLQFTATDSVTHAEVAEQVQHAWAASLRGDRSVEWVIPSARYFGSERASLLQVQLDQLAGGRSVASGMGSLAHHGLATDTTATAELWPAFVATCLDAGSFYGPRHQLDQLLDGPSGPVVDLVGALAQEHTRSGGLTIDFSYAPAFDTAVRQARELAKAGRDADALARIFAALPDWRPRSGIHLAPVGLLADRDTARLFTPEPRLRLLTTPRATSPV